MPYITVEGHTFQLGRSQLEALATGESAYDPIPSFDRQVLWQVCENVSSYSEVTLAAEMSVDVQLIMLSLDELNSRGLVIYALRQKYDSYGVRLQKIRATASGYLTMGYPPGLSMVGNKMYRLQVPIHPGDMTDFRTQEDCTWGGDIERLPFAVHCAKYPTHIHGEVEMPTNRTDTDAWLQKTSAALGVTPEQMASMTIDEIKDKGVAQREAYALRKIATATVQSEGADTSLSKRILKVLRNGPVDDVDALKSALFFTHEDQHNARDITKAVWSLQKRNLVTFYERKTGGGDSLLTKIKLTRQGMRDQGVIPEHDSAKPDKVKGSGELKRPSKVGKDMTDANRHHYIAKGDAVEVVHEGIPAYRPITEIAPSPRPVVSVDPPRQNEKAVTDEGSRTTDMGRHAEGMRKAAPWESIRDVIKAEFPLLTAILDKTDKQAAFVMAAEALDGVDDATADTLRGRIQLTALEEEIVRLVSKMG